MIKQLLINKFPHLYDESMSLYELISKVVYYLNQCIDGVNDINEKLYEFIHWFENLDVSNEVNAKLDEMALDGSLAEIINHEIFEQLNQDISIVKNNIESKYINVKLLGAKGDGVTDDYAAIQNAINNLEGGQVLFFPIGTYIVSKTIVLPNFNINPLVRIEGNNKRTTIIKYTGDDVLIDGVGTEELRKYFYIKSLRFEATNTLATTCINMAWNPARTILEDLHIEYFNKGIYTTNNWNISLYDVYIMNCTTSGLEMLNPTNAFVINGGKYNRCGTNIKLEGRGHVLNGVDIAEGKTYSLHCRNVKGATFNSLYLEYFTGQNGIYLQASDGIIIDGLNISIFVENTKILWINACRGIVINGFNCEGSQAKTSGYGIYIQDSYGTIINGIRLQGCHTGIYLQNGDVTVNGVSNDANVTYVLQTFNHTSARAIMNCYMDVYSKCLLGELSKPGIQWNFINAPKYGNNASRPNAITPGMTYYNTEVGKLQVSNGIGEWIDT